MTRLVRRVSLPVAFSLFTSAATAYAECAWMLWSETIAIGQVPGWAINGTSETKQECDGAARAAYRQVGEPDARANTLVPRRVDKNRTMGQFICPPDIQDPRDLKK